MRYPLTAVIASSIIAVIVFSLLPSPRSVMASNPDTAAEPVSESSTERAADAGVAILDDTQDTNETGEPGVMLAPTLTLELTDGSQLKGRPSFESMPVKTSFDRVDVPLTQLQHVAFQKHNKAILHFRNGDRLTGQPLISQIGLSTLGGMITVELEHLVQATIGGKVLLSDELSEHMVLYYSFDSQDDGVIDLSGHGNHGVNYEARYTEQGAVNGAYAFDGISAFVRCEDHPSLDLTEQMTIVFWVNPGTPVADYAAQLLYKASPLPKRDAMIAWYYFGTTHSAPTAHLSPHLTVDGSWEAVSGFRGDPGQWYHVAVTFHREGLELYKDGQQINAKQTVGTLATNNQPLLIGKGWGKHHGRAANAVMDELMIFNIAMTPGQIRELYQSQRWAVVTAASAPPSQPE